MVRIYWHIRLGRWKDCYITGSKILGTRSWCTLQLSIFNRKELLQEWKLATLDRYQFGLLVGTEMVCICISVETKRIKSNRLCVESMPAIWLVFVTVSAPRQDIGITLGVGETKFCSGIWRRTRSWASCGWDLWLIRVYEKNTFIYVKSVWWLQYCDLSLSYCMLVCQLSNLVDGLRHTAEDGFNFNSLLDDSNEC